MEVVYIISFVWPVVAY